MTEPVVLLDSNCCIYIIEGLSDRLRRRVEDFAPGECVTSAICYGEVARGVARDDPQKVRNFEALFEIVPVLPFDAAAGAEYARLPFARHRLDRLIAAHALALDLTLVTANTRDFADLPTLRVEDWTR